MWNSAKNLSVRSASFREDGDDKDALCLVDCGQGTCNASNAALLGYDCKCNPGWGKIQIGSVIFPSCVLPNCTIDFECSNVAPPTQPPSPPPAVMSLLNDRSLGPDCAALGLIPELLQPPGSSPSEVAPPWAPPLHNNGSNGNEALGYSSEALKVEVKIARWAEL
ncbi:hypothetical protein F0562_030019 [Nyssa sinensis]|uniref:EGF-like domain-containing protein n=1 Tax=Nyssa sinensis TaxID=561372 RepID=A0A5J5AYV7_9ASTE|nr:hypothetical protein F0562_030019 [Nyssa sinensis]